MRLVVIESPYAGDVERNVEYARRAMFDCIVRGEAPLASHLLYTQPGVLRDENEIERNYGIRAGLAWADAADTIAFYIDYGWSSGMYAALDHHTEQRAEIEHRRIGVNP